MKTGALVFFAIMSISFCISYFATLDKLKKTNLALAKLFIAKEALEDIVMQNRTVGSDSEDTLHKENFIKFLSDSRDWAFEYIENSQQVIKEVSEELNNNGLTSYSEKLMSLLPDIPIKDKK